MFPPDIMRFLRDVLDPVPVSDGPPYTHTFRNPPTEYDDEGEPLRPRIQPTYSIVDYVEAAVQEAVVWDGRCLAIKLPPHPLTLAAGLTEGLQL